LFCCKSFQIHFEKEQNPVSVSVKDGNLKGLDLLAGSHKDKKKRKCDFKLLQLLIEEKDPKENQTGKATATKPGIFNAGTQQAVPQRPSATMSFPQ
jgi:hypothetical protein